MISIKKQKTKHFCCEPLENIENFQEAVNDKTQQWCLHHRLEIGEDYENTEEQLKMMGLYYNRPACELIYLPMGIHTSLHNKHKLKLGKLKSFIGNRKGKKSKPLTEEQKKKLSEARKGIKPKNWDYCLQCLRAKQRNK